MLSASFQGILIFFIFRKLFILYLMSCNGFVLNLINFFQCDCFISWNTHKLLISWKLLSTFLILAPNFSLFGIWLVKLLGKACLFPIVFTSGYWLQLSQGCHPAFIKAISAATVWFIWKAKCNYIFRNELPNYNTIASKAIGHAKEFSSYAKPQLGKSLIISNFFTSDGPLIFTSVVWHEEHFDGDTGFFISNSNLSIFLAGCSYILTISRMDAEANALIVALNNICNNNVSVQHIFISYSKLLAAIKIGWCFNHWITTIRNLIISTGNPRIHVIPRCRIGAAYKFAMHGSNLHITPLFHQDRDFIRWIMKFFVWWL